LSEHSKIEMNDATVEPSAHQHEGGSPLAGPEPCSKPRNALVRKTTQGIATSRGKE
jgi:hypothetical protein